MLSDLSWGCSSRDSPLPAASCRDALCSISRGFLLLHILGLGLGFFGGRSCSKNPLWERRFPTQPRRAEPHGAVPVPAGGPFSAAPFPPQVSWYRVTCPSREIRAPDPPEKMSGMQVSTARVRAAPLWLGVGGAPQTGGSHPPRLAPPPGRVAVRYGVHRQVQLPRHRRAGPALQQGGRPHHRRGHQGKAPPGPQSPQGGRAGCPPCPCPGAAGGEPAIGIPPGRPRVAPLSPRAGNGARRWVN